MRLWAAVTGLVVAALLVVRPGTSGGRDRDGRSGDVAFSYRFLRAAGAGTAQGQFRRLRSVRDAIAFLGERPLRAWVTLMLVKGATSASPG